MLSAAAAADAGGGPNDDWRASRDTNEPDMKTNGSGTGASRSGQRSPDDVIRSSGSSGPTTASVVAPTNTKPRTVFLPHVALLCDMVITSLQVSTRIGADVLDCLAVSAIAGK